MKRIAIIGASGAIGSSFVKHYVQDDNIGTIHAFSRTQCDVHDAKIIHGQIDLASESSIEKAAEQASSEGDLDLVIVASGILHENSMMPEKSLRDLSADKFAALFTANTTGPALVMKHFLPQLARERRAVFAALSARVGSISDNRLGGWYAYRASKAALNMVIKNAGIEMARRYKNAVIIGIHPGTVDSELSKPFQSSVDPEKLFSPEHSTQQMIEVIAKVSPSDTGKCFAYDGLEILP